MTIGWWMLIAGLLGVGAAFLERHFEKKRIKKHEEICKGVTTEVEKTIKHLKRLNNKS